MKERLKDYLEHGEEILWHGRAEQFEAMDKTHKAYYIRRGVIAAAVLILLIALYIPTAIKTGAGIKPGVVIVIAAAGLYGVFSPFLDVRKLRKMEYVLTNEKLMLVTSGDVRSVKLSAIPTARMASDDDGHWSLLCGPDCDSLAPCKRRVATLAGAILDQDSMMCDRFVMYGVDDVQGLRAASVGHLTIA